MLTPHQIELVKATVSDRKAVFELAQTTETNKEVPGVRNIPLDLAFCVPSN